MGQRKQWVDKNEGRFRERAKKRAKKGVQKEKLQEKKKAMSGQKNTIHGSSTGRKKGKIH